MKEILDSDSAAASKIDLTFKNGNVFSTNLRFAISVLGVLGVPALISGGAGIIVGPFLLFFSVYALTANYGTLISLENNYVKEFDAVFWIKRGKWKSTALLPYISIVKLGKAIPLTGQKNKKPGIKSKDNFEVCLLSDSHRKRVLLKECATFADALKSAESLADVMNKKLVVYKPYISPRTLAKRYERH